MLDKRPVKNRSCLSFLLSLTAANLSTRTTQQGDDNAGTDTAEQAPGGTNSLDLNSDVRQTDSHEQAACSQASIARSCNPVPSFSSIHRNAFFRNRARSDITLHL